MSTEAERRELFEALESSLGRGPATTLMELLPPMGWGDIARRSDVDAMGVALRGDITALRAEFKGDLAELRGEFVETRAELKGDIAEVKGEIAELKGGFAELRAEVKSEIAELRGEIAGILPKQIAASMGMACAVTGMVIAAAHLI